MDKLRKVKFLHLMFLLSIVFSGSIEASEPIDYSFSVYLPLVSNSRGVETIPNQYIIVFKDDLVDTDSVLTATTELVSSYGGNMLYAYDSVLKGFAANIPPDTLTETLSAIQDDERVAYIEQDAFVSIDTTQPDPPWGLDRIDQRSLPLNSNYVYDNTGMGVRVYIIDTGIRTSHNEFGGRATSGYDVIDGQLPANDCNGHGTHVAGIVGGNTYGVAKNAQLIAVRVFGCSNTGRYSDFIEGVNWVTQQRLANPHIPAVANMSLGGPISRALEEAVSNSMSAGVTYVVSAGNDSRDACYQSPARIPDVITVGATTSSDTRAGYSNYGTCVDIFAPGSDIISAWYNSNTATRTLNGTSMAAPHVAGIAALYLQSYPNASPPVVSEAILDGATLGKVRNPGSGSPNRLLYSRFSYTTDNPTWYLRNSNNGGWEDILFRYGRSNDIPVAGDWNGDGIDTIGVFRSDSANWYLKNDNDGGSANLVFKYGVPGDTPLVGDWDGDGVDTIGIYRSNSGEWHLRNSNSAGDANITFKYGRLGDTPLVGDWDGDGVDTVGIYRGSSGEWYLRNSNSAGWEDITFKYGRLGDIPLVGDWNGDGVDTVGIYRSNNREWHLRNSNTAGDGDITFKYGIPGDTPLVGDWDGNISTTPGVVR